jgi:hypothetical protein
LGKFEGRAEAAPIIATGPMDVLMDVPPSPMPATWLPDDPDLLSDLGVAPESPVSPLPMAQTATDTAAPDRASLGVTLLSRTDCGLTVLATEAGTSHPRQRAAAAVRAIGRDMPASDFANGMHVLRTQLMALNPPLQHASEDLIDPVPENCAVIAVHVTGTQADLLRIGDAAAWHWRQGRLQPCFAQGMAPAAVDTGADDDFNDLLFSAASPSMPGLGAAAQPACSDISCAAQPGDRLLLMATQPLLQLPPEVLAHALAMPSRDDACRHLATAAGLGAEATCWPLAIIEIDA